MQIVGCDTFFQFLERKMPQPESNKGWKSEPMTENQRSGVCNYFRCNRTQAQRNGDAWANVGVA